MEIYVEATPENSDGIIGQPADEVLNKIYLNTGTEEHGCMVYNEETMQPRRPIGIINIIPKKAIAEPVDIYIENLSDNEKGEAIKKTLSDMVYGIRPFIAGAQSASTKSDTISQPMLLSSIFTLLAGTGVSFTSLTMQINGIETGSKTFYLGNYPYIRTIYNNGTPIA